MANHHSENDKDSIKEIPQMKKMELGQLTWDKHTWPRNNKSNVTVEAYVESMSIGAEFPPIEAQPVSNYPDPETGELKDATIIIDGLHRWLAYQELNKKQDNVNQVESVEVKYWRQDRIDYLEHKIELMLEAADRNVKHGDRLGQSDKETVAQKIAKADPEQEWSNKAIADRLSVDPSTVSRWISATRAQQTADRDARIIKLSRLGWTQQEIADLLDIDRTTVSKIVKNLRVQEIHNLLADNRSMDYIANHLHMDLPLVWALRLKDDSDIDRFGGSPDSKKPAKNLKWGIRTWGDWRFQECDKRFGDPWPGRIPAQLVAHTLFFFTKEGNLVLDPMAGGGVVPDVCLTFGRQCRAFDIKTRPERPEIQAHYWNPDNMTWPEALTDGYNRKPDLIFFDPPYYKKKETEYTEGTQEDTMPISSLPRDKYLAFFRDFFTLAYQNSKPEARLALVIADWRDFQGTSALKEKQDSAVLLHEYYDLLRNCNWNITHNIQCPMSSERFAGSMVSAMQEKREIGTVERMLIVARKG